jgi:hypothetical protein
VWDKGIALRDLAGISAFTDRPLAANLSLGSVCAPCG